MNSVMIPKYRIVIILISVIIIWQTIKFFPRFQYSKTDDIDHGPAASGDIKPVLVSVFYEALCPDSKNFFVKQLKPSIDKASRLFNVSLIPYGKAKTEESSDGSLFFTCQHGPTECLANKIHACAISKIPDQDLKISYITCMISDNMVPELIGETCAKNLNVDWKPILQCANSQKGSDLLKEFGIITDSMYPKMSFVPTVLLDNKHFNQAAILKDFFNQACKLFKKMPEECLS